MKITIRVGAAYDDIIIDGYRFDRSKLNRHQRDAMRGLIMDALFPNWRRRK